MRDQFRVQVYSLGRSEGASQRKIQHNILLFAVALSNLFFCTYLLTVTSPFLRTFQR